MLPVLLLRPPTAPSSSPLPLPLPLRPVSQILQPTPQWW
jgi:hypothetical protein